MAKRGFHFHSNEIEKSKKRVGIALVIVLIALIIYGGYFFVFYAKPCSDISCFSNAIKNCNRVSFVKEDLQASWLYTIKGADNKDSCIVNVKLLKMKQGTIDSEKLQGEEMNCILNKGDTQFPEKEISQCSGKLKEEIQDIIIQRMHSYLLENVGEIKQEFNSI